MMILTLVGHKCIFWNVFLVSTYESIAVHHFAWMITNACSSSFNKLSIWQSWHERFSLRTVLMFWSYPAIPIFLVIWAWIISCTIRCITEKVTAHPMSEVVSTRVMVTIIKPFNSRNEKSYKDVAWNVHLYLLVHFYQLLTTRSFSYHIMSF